MNESLLITQIIQKNERAYALLLPFGAPYTEIYEALDELMKNNKDKQAAAIESEAAKLAEAQPIENNDVPTA